jgi:hypothetical protein
LFSKKIFPLKFGTIVQESLIFQGFESKSEKMHLLGPEAKSLNIGEKVAEKSPFWKTGISPSS